MATIELCDLCGGKSKRALCSVTLRGSLPAFKNGVIPAPPDGFKYHEDSLKNSFGKVTYEKVWDNVGRVIKETKYIQAPKKFKALEIDYDLCELCFEKFMVLLETIKKKYHLEQTEMRLIEDKSNVWGNPFLALGGPEDED